MSATSASTLCWSDNHPLPPPSACVLHATSISWSSDNGEIGSQSHGKPPNAFPPLFSAFHRRGTAAARFNRLARHFSVVTLRLCRQCSRSSPPPRKRREGERERETVVGVSCVDNRIFRRAWVFFLFFRRTVEQCALCDMASSLCWLISSGFGTELRLTWLSEAVWSGRKGMPNTKPF